MTMSSTAIFDHVGLSVADLDEAVRWYSRVLELKAEFEFDLREFGLRGVMLLSPTGYRLELLDRAPID
jgi:catechol 2,3-dioxygenase-like lactoylglutathione lyase family enzyme